MCKIFILQYKNIPVDVYLQIIHQLFLDVLIVFFRVYNE